MKTCTDNLTIKVLSVYDSLNYDEVLVEVYTPSSMIMLHSFPVETVVGSHLQAAVTMKIENVELIYCYAECSALHGKDS